MPLDQSFRGLLSVHSRYGLHARQVAYATLYTGGSDGFVAFTAAPIATGWSEPFPGGTFTRSEPAPFTAHVITGVESRTGAVTVVSRWIVDWAFAASPQSGLAWFCFLFPLIEPDWQISRIRLSEKTHAFAHGRFAVR